MKPNYINGTWLDGSAAVDNINPSDISDVIGAYAQADVQQTELAISAATYAFTSWSHENLQKRSDVLDNIGNEILARKEELGHLLAREEGKTLGEGIGETVRAGHIFKFFAGEVLRQSGDHLASVRSGVQIDVTREPLGVIGIITPWNFPIAIPAWKIAPALAYGNCVVFKPAELVPGSAWALTEIISRSGIPAGVFNLVMGKGSIVGQTILDSSQVAGISFTGSTTTGRRVMNSAAARFARVQLEMGGKNPLVILDDADLDIAVDCALLGSFGSTGQRCTASSRLIVTHGIVSRFTQALTEAVSKLKVGHALTPSTEIGPVVDVTQLEQDLDYVRIGKEEGADLATGGGRMKCPQDGYYLQPALFTDAANTMRIAREEIFGPVACIIPARDYDEALSLANDTEFGLSAGICTTSLKHSSHFKRYAKSGMVMVNTPTAGVDYHVPFGGTKGSSFGPREQGSYAAEFYTVVKTAYTHP